MGIADFTTRRLFDQLDLQKTYMNGLTANALDAIKIPVVMASDREALEAALKAANPSSCAAGRLDQEHARAAGACWCQRRCCQRSRVSTLVVEGAAAELAFDEEGSLIREGGRVLLAHEAGATVRR